jgi:hypothetical protein
VFSAPTVRETAEGRAQGHRVERKRAEAKPGMVPPLGSGLPAATTPQACAPARCGGAGSACVLVRARRLEGGVPGVLWG